MTSCTFIAAKRTRQLRGEGQSYREIADELGRTMDVSVLP